MVRYELMRDLPGVPAGTIGTLDGLSTMFYTFKGPDQSWSYRESDLRRYGAEWFRPIPDTPPVPAPLYFSGEQHNRNHTEFTHVISEGHRFILGFVSKEDSLRFGELVGLLYKVFANRRNVECGSVPFERINERAYAYNVTCGLVGYGRVLGDGAMIPPYVWPTEEMADAYAAFQRLLFGREGK